MRKLRLRGIRQLAMGRPFIRGRAPDSKSMTVPLSSKVSQGHALLSPSVTTFFYVLGFNLPHCTPSHWSKFYLFGSSQPNIMAIPGKVVHCQLNPHIRTHTRCDANYFLPENYRWSDFSSGLTQDKAEPTYADPAIRSRSKAVTWK